jgi:hypothetical protein
MKFVKCLRLLRRSLSDRHGHLLVMTGATSVAVDADCDEDGDESAVGFVVAAGEKTECPPMVGERRRRGGDTIRGVDGEGEVVKDDEARVVVVVAAAVHTSGVEMIVAWDGHVADVVGDEGCTCTVLPSAVVLIAKEIPAWRHQDRWRPNCYCWALWAAWERHSTGWSAHTGRLQHLRPPLHRWDGDELDAMVPVAVVARIMTTARLPLPQ